ELPREAVAVFTRDDEGLNHFRLLEVAVELVQLGEPESETICIWISSQVTEVFHHHKSVVELGANETTVLSNTSERLGPRQRACSQPTHQRVTLSRREAHSGVRDQSIDVICIRQIVIRRVELRSVDEAVNKRFRVRGQHSLPTVDAHSNPVTNRPCIRHKVCKVWSSPVTGAIKSINQNACLLELNRQEIRSRNVFFAPSDAVLVSTTFDYLIAPEVEAGFIR